MPAKPPKPRNRTINKIDIDTHLHIYKCTNSHHFHARFKLNKRWYTKTTRCTDIEQATIAAVRIKTEYTIKLANNINVQLNRRYTNTLFSTLCSTVLNSFDSSDATQMKYAGILRRHFIPFFGSMHMQDITQEIINDYETVRDSKKQYATATIKIHITCVNLVFELALKYNIISTIPKFSVPKKIKSRRDSFTTKQIQTISNHLKAYTTADNKTRKDIILESLFYFTKILELTGMRCGTEIFSLKYSNVRIVEDTGRRLCHIDILNGKTVKHTGTMTLVCDAAVYDCIQQFKTVQQSHTVLELTTIFNYDLQKLMQKWFKQLLKKLNMEKGMHGALTLYSYRHYYITKMLENNISPALIASQCRTSIQIIDRNYSHVRPKNAVDLLVPAQGILHLKTEIKD